MDVGEKRSPKKDVSTLVSMIKNKAIEQVGLKDLLRPDGFAQNIAQSLNVKRVQLRKIYSEFKGIFDMTKKEGRLSDEALNKLYMLYPIIEYQRSRQVISTEFAKLMTALAENIEKFPTKSNLEAAEKFLTALVAYSRDK